MEYLSLGVRIITANYWINALLLLFNKKINAMDEIKESDKTNGVVCLPFNNLKRIEITVSPTTKKLGYFHLWGTDSYEFHGETVSRTVAIFEYDDGEVGMVSPHKIKFLH